MAAGIDVGSVVYSAMREWRGKAGHDSGMKKSFARTPAFSTLIIIAVAVLLLSLIIALSFGPSRLPVHTVWEVILYHLTGIRLDTFSPAQEHIVLYLRFPRVFLAAITGSGDSLQRQAGALGAGKYVRPDSGWAGRPRNTAI